MTIHINELSTRFLTCQYFAEVMAIDEFANEWEAWQPKFWIRLMEQQSVSGKVVVDLRGTVLGFMVYQIEVDCLTLIRIAVIDSPRPEQILRVLLEELCGSGFVLGRRVEAFVQERDLASLQLLREIGWQGSLCNDFGDDDEDIVRMVYAAAEVAKSAEETNASTTLPR